MAILWNWTVESSRAAPERADRAIAQALESAEGRWEGIPDGEPPPALSRSQVQRLLEEGRITVNGAPARSNAKLAPGAVVRLELPPAAPLELQPEDRPLDILFQDEHLAVVNKPPGLTVHPSETQTTGTLVHALLHHIRDLSGIGGVARPGIVHRIDKDTSGVLVITKTDAAHLKLSEVFAKHDLERRYWALCYGDLENSGAREQKIESILGRNPADRKRMASGVKEGRRAVTWVRRIEAYGVPGAKPFASLVEARLETGRTHQVRVHLTDQGHSLLGDPVYGKPSSRNNKWLALPEDIRTCVEALPGQALHARVLAFHHPITGQPLRFEAEPPEAFRLLCEALRRYR